MLTKAKSFLSSWKNLLALGALFPLGGWIYSRVWMVNPAILGDEYLYSLNARKVAPWDPSPAGDFSNYLFNFVYQGTNLCGEAFYTCGKIFNLFFFLGFIFILYIVAIRFLPFWAAFGFMIAAGLSPLSVYTSMFLPESMYLFFMGLLLISTLRAMKENFWYSWTIVGSIIGIASLVKPHAWLSAIAVAITILIVGLGSSRNKIRIIFLNGVGLVTGAILARILVGLLVAGPKALSFFGQYLGGSTIEQVVRGTQSESQSSLVGSTPLNGVFGLFSTQLNTHLLVMSALMGIFILSVTVSVGKIFIVRRLDDTLSFALFSFVWFFVLMIEVVIFTGWVTGGGDDHTTRVLLRYYEFLFAIVPLAGIASLISLKKEKPNAFIRWSMVIALSLLLTPAFSGFFASLTIQIADAPTLAGLVVNMELFNLIAILSMVAISVFAIFPRYSIFAAALLVPFTFAGLGWQIQEQYQIFRAVEIPADKAGKYLSSSFSEDELDKSLIIATSRFDATLTALWADSKGIAYEQFPPGSRVDGTGILADYIHVTVVGDIELANLGGASYQGDGFVVFTVR